MAEDAPRQIVWLEHRGCIFSRLPDGRIAQRPFGGAGSPRTCYSRRRHRPRHPAHLVGAARTLRGQGLRRVLRDGPLRRRRRRHGRRGLQYAFGRTRTRHGRSHDLRDGRSRPRLRQDDQRLCIDGRRHGDRLSGRHPPHGYGIRAIPPDLAQRKRRAPLGSGARRGRLPPQQRGGALHVQIRAQQGRTGLARRRQPRRVDGNPGRARGRRLRVPGPAAPRARENPRTPAADS